MVAMGEWRDCIHRPNAVNMTSGISVVTVVIILGADITLVCRECFLSNTNSMDNSSGGFT